MGNYLLECTVVPAILADRLQFVQTNTLTIEAKRLMTTSTASLPKNLEELRASGWTSRTVKQEIYKNFIDKLALGEPLYPGIVGYDDTVVPELNIALLAGHDLLFLGEKGQAKSRLMRTLVRFLDEYVPYIDHPDLMVHEDPERPITTLGKKILRETPASEVSIKWWHREDRYVERLAPGTKFADVIGEIDPAKLTSGVSMSSEEALHFGLIPRMHRGIFAMNELPELDELVQVGLFNILEERDGADPWLPYPIRSGHFYHVFSKPKYLQSER
jgi:magnesium chelatase subunit I